MAPLPGARVLCACRDEDKGKAAVADIKETTGSKTVFFRKLDLASFTSIREFAEKIKNSKHNFLCAKRNFIISHLECWTAAIESYAEKYFQNYLSLV